MPKTKYSIYNKVRAIEKAVMVDKVVKPVIPMALAIMLYLSTIARANLSGYPPASVPSWIDTGSNSWMLTAATLVGLQSVPGLMLLYGGMTKRKYAINTIASLMPSRRARKLHIGLFGYSRGFRGITLPRAIPFVASLYSLGIPPEIIGVSTLRDLGEEEWRVLNEYYLGWRRDLDNAGKYVCLECIQLIMNYRSELGIVNSEIFTKIEDDIRALEWLGIKVGPRDYESRRHELYAQLLINSLREGRYDDLRKYVIEMARIRGFLG